MALTMVLLKIKSNPTHPLSGALSLPYVPARVTRGPLFAHSHSFAPTRCRTSQCRRTFVPLSVSLLNDHGDPVFNDVGLVGFKSRANALLWPNLLFLFVSYYFLFFFLPRVDCVGLGSSD